MLSPDTTNASKVLDRTCTLSSAVHCKPLHRCANGQIRVGHWMPFRQDVGSSPAMCWAPDGLRRNARSQSHSHDNAWQEIATENGRVNIGTWHGSSRVYTRTRQCFLPGFSVLEKQALHDSMRRARRCVTEKSRRPFPTPSNTPLSASTHTQSFVNVCWDTGARKLLFVSWDSWPTSVLALPRLSHTPVAPPHCTVLWGRGILF